ncbi:MAG: fatty acyl-AMP ligase [Planctomycetaceae bacterium]
MKSFCTVLSEAAAAHPEKRLFIFPENRWRGEEYLTYGGLASGAAAAAQVLTEFTHVGDRVLLMFATGNAFWESFMGCLARGAIAVPLNIPNLNRVSEELDQVCKDCNPAALLMDDKTAELLRKRADKHPLLSKIPVITPNSWQESRAGFNSKSVNENQIAFLQYTSGSTSNPKAVQVSHGNLFTNSDMIQDQMRIRTAEDLAVTWLPHYHDMGLVGGYLGTMFARITSWCLQPEDFALEPAKWLRLISQHRGTVCGGPDFAYRACVDKVKDEQLENVDLSSWRVAFVGAERIHADTIRRFTDRFSSYGFRQKSFFPCYGLAEATLMVCGGPTESVPEIRSVSADALMQDKLLPPTYEADCTELVSSGQTFDGCEVIILDTESDEPLPDDRIGEVCVAGDAVTCGYFNDDEANRTLFKNTQINDQSLKLLRTGDLGFLSNGELFITGRSKELIIIRGRNFYPDDIEQKASISHEALSPGGTVAFSTELHGEESLVIAAELRRTAIRTENPETIFPAIRHQIVDAFGVSPAAIILLRTASIPRTSSGKPKRMLVRERFINGTIDGVCDDRDLK